MVDYWLDSNSLITPKNGPYGFDIAPGFWRLLEQNALAGTIRSPTFVYHELVDKSDDELAAWAAQNKDSGLFVEPDAPVQATFRTIADYERGQPQSKKVKIPDVCRNFSVQCTDTYQMVRGLGASFELRS